MLPPHLRTGAHGLLMQRCTFNHQQFQLKIRGFFLGTFSIPTKNLQKPPKSRLLRDLDDAFLQNLTREMEKVPEGNYGIIYVCAIDCTKETFDSSKVHQYQYEILGGLHNTMAAKNLLAKFPNNEHFLKRHARVYAGLGNEEAVWLSTRHNLAASFRHEIKFKEEVCCSHFISSNVLLCPLHQHNTVPHPSPLTNHNFYGAQPFHLY